jgi:hypothetical protein
MAALPVEQRAGLCRRISGIGEMGTDYSEDRAKRKTDGEATYHYFRNRVAL